MRHFMYIEAQNTQGKREHRCAAQVYIIEVYAVLLLAVFPFYNKGHYFSVLSDRARFFCVATWLMVTALLVSDRRRGGGEPGILGQLRKKPWSIRSWQRSSWLA